MSVAKQVVVKEDRGQLGCELQAMQAEMRRRPLALQRAAWLRGIPPERHAERDR